MKVSREQVLENKKAILKAAGRLFRERGFEAVTVADVMKSAGLTHGGFYGYFKSKDDLIAQALAEVLGPAAAPPADLAAMQGGICRRRIGTMSPAAARWRRWPPKPFANPAAHARK